jgi:hypothetical protein
MSDLQVNCINEKIQHAIADARQPKKPGGKIQGEGSEVTKMRENQDDRGRGWEMRSLRGRRWREGGGSRGSFLMREINRGCLLLFIIFLLLELEEVEEEERGFEEEKEVELEE